MLFSVTIEPANIINLIGYLLLILEPCVKYFLFLMNNSELEY